MSHYKNVIETAKELKKSFKDLTNAEALLIASKIEQAELLANVLKEGLLISTSDKPVALEAIAMQLGFNGSLSGTDLTEAAMMIHEAIAKKE